MPIVYLHEMRYEPEPYELLCDNLRMVIENDPENTTFYFRELQRYLSDFSYLKVNYKNAFSANTNITDICISSYSVCDFIPDLLQDNYSVVRVIPDPATVSTVLFSDNAKQRLYKILERNSVLQAYCDLPGIFSALFTKSLWTYKIRQSLFSKELQLLESLSELIIKSNRHNFLSEIFIKQLLASDEHREVSAENLKSWAAIINFAERGNFISRDFMSWMLCITDPEARRTLATIARKFLPRGEKKPTDEAVKNFQWLCRRPHLAKNFSYWLAYSPLVELFTQAEREAEANRVVWHEQLEHDFGIQAQWLEALHLTEQSQHKDLYLQLFFHEPRVEFTLEKLNDLVERHKLRQHSTTETTEKEVWPEMKSPLNKGAQNRIYGKIWFDELLSNKAFSELSPNFVSSESYSLDLSNLNLVDKRLDRLITYWEAQPKTRIDTLNLSNTYLDASRLSKLTVHFLKSSAGKVQENNKLGTDFTCRRLLLNGNSIGKYKRPPFVNKPVEMLVDVLLKCPWLEVIHLSDCDWSISDLRILRGAVNRREAPIWIQISSTRKIERSIDLLNDTLVRRLTRAWLLGATVPLDQRTPAIQAMQSFLGMNAELYIPKQYSAKETVFEEMALAVSDSEEPRLKVTSLPEALSVFQELLEHLVIAFGAHESDPYAAVSLEGVKKNAKKETEGLTSMASVYYERIPILKKALDQYVSKYPANTVTDLPYQKQLECFAMFQDVLIVFTLGELPTQDKVEKIRQQSVPRSPQSCAPRLVDFLQQALLLGALYKGATLDEPEPFKQGEDDNANEWSAFAGPLECFYLGVKMATSPYVSSNAIQERDILYLAYDTVVSLAVSMASAIPKLDDVCKKFGELIHLSCFKDSDHMVGITTKFPGFNQCKALIERGLRVAREKIGIRAHSTVTSLRIAAHTFTNDDLTKILIKSTYYQFKSAYAGLLVQLSSDERIYLFKALSYKLIEQLGIGALTPSKKLIHRSERVKSFVSEAMMQLVYLQTEANIPWQSALRSSSLICHRYKKGQKEAEEFQFQWSHVLVHPRFYSNTTLKHELNPDEVLGRGTRHATQKELELFNALKPSSDGLEFRWQLNFGKGIKIGSLFYEKGVAGIECVWHAKSHEQVKALSQDRFVAIPCSYKPMEERLDVLEEQTDGHEVTIQGGKEKLKQVGSKIRRLTDKVNAHRLKTKYQYRSTQKVLQTIERCISLGVDTMSSNHSDNKKLIRFEQSLAQLKNQVTRKRIDMKKQQAKEVPLLQAQAVLNRNKSKDVDNNSKLIPVSAKAVTSYNIPKGLKIEIMPKDGDGHCLFDAIRYVLWGKKDELAEVRIDKVMKLRGRVADFYERKKNDNRFNAVYKDAKVGNDPNTTEYHKSFEAYIAAIRAGTKWGGSDEVRVLQEIYRRPIVVITPYAQQFDPNWRMYFGGNPVFLFYNGTNHYDALSVCPGFNAINILKAIERQIQLANEQVERARHQQHLLSEVVVDSDALMRENQELRKELDRARKDNSDLQAKLEKYFKSQDINHDKQQKKTESLQTLNNNIAEQVDALNEESPNHEENAPRGLVNQLAFFNRSKLQKNQSEDSPCNQPEDDNVHKP